MAQIAFLGLGAMGTRMATRLLDAGHTLDVWNRSPGPADDLVAKGARLARTPCEAVENAEFVLAMVRDDAASQSVWQANATGALHGLKRGAVGIEMSTLTPARIRALASAVQAAGGTLVDAPLAGSRPQAEAGQLLFLAGGPVEAVERAKPILLAMGAAVHRAGESGRGMAMKLIVNTLLGVQCALVGELLVLAEQLGIERKTAAAILGEMPVMSATAKGLAAGMLSRAFAPQFPIDLMVKDLGYVADAADHAGAEASLAHTARALFEAAAARGWGDANMTAVIQLFEALARPPAPTP